jgi:hypothetical protein
MSDTRRLDPGGVRRICEAACMGLREGGIGYSDEAVQQLVFTVGAEVSGRDITRQLGGGPAITWWQIEPATIRDIAANWLRYRPAADAAIRRHLPAGDDLEAGALDDPMIAAMLARIQYRRSPLKLQPVDDIWGQAVLWKSAYNTHAGKGTVEEAMERYLRWVNE